jgi:hypothetical protein
MLTKIMPRILLAILLLGILRTCSACRSTSENPKVAGKIVDMEFDEGGWNSYPAGDGSAQVEKPPGHWITTENSQGKKHSFVANTDEEVQAFWVKFDKFKAGELVFWP